VPLPPLRTPPYEPVGGEKINDLAHEAVDFLLKFHRPQYKHSPV
jgi:hypothetical protein